MSYISILNLRNICTIKSYDKGILKIRGPRTRGNLGKSNLTYWERPPPKGFTCNPQFPLEQKEFFFI